MLKLTEREYDFYTWNGVRLELNLAFDNVLLLFELFEDESINEYMKIDIAINMLVVDESVSDQLSMEQRSTLLLDILKDKLDIDLNSLMKKKIEEKEEEKVPTIPIVDFVVDAERIFSSFLFDYNIDLFEQQGKMHWNKFMALFRNFSNKSPMGQALYYRTCNIPPKDKHNADERKQIKKMKELYELPKAKEIREQQEFEAFQKKMEAQKLWVEGR
ncbi:Gp15 family bacteriophage protein [Bacillus bingmayongensis]|uniref:Gp15 family bacteriophage protein n=1 Tax=Bacillus bingmayongensis TaxID=1150157 RepID=UPI001C8D0FC4|nr:Gp15 family bacteriophage protein [Bacillus bingmayongensis]MBY0597683.1 bacteriophage Gp15 family protein [Bacillus bingmayongensis]